MKARGLTKGEKHNIWTAFEKMIAAGLSDDRCEKAMDAIISAHCRMNDIVVIDLPSREPP